MVNITRKNSKHNFEDDSILSLKGERGTKGERKVREQQKVLTTEDNWDMIRFILLDKLPEVTEREYAKQAQFML